MKLGVTVTHYANMVYVGPEEDGYPFAKSEIFAELPCGSRRTNVCKTCWRQSATALRLSEEAGSSSSSSSSSVSD